jgi:ACS family D-galactonate transporter-like MFS transporter
LTRTIRGREWLVVALLSAGFTIAYIDRTNLSIAIAAREFVAEFGLTASQRGLLGSAFFWSYALLQVPAGYLTDRFGVRIPYAVSFAVWSLVTAATALAGDLWRLVALRLLLGAGEAIVTPASLRWISLNVPEANRGLAVGILFSGAKFGPAIGSFAAAALIAAIGWRGMFLALGLGSLLFLPLWLKFVPPDRGSESRRETSSGALGNIWKTPAIYGILIGTVSYNYFNYFNLTWLPAYFVDQWGFSLNEMGAYATFSFLGMGLTAIGGGWMADTLIRRGGAPLRVRRGFTIAGLLTASLVVGGVLVDSRQAAVGIAIVSMAGLGLTTANYWALTQHLMPGGAIGRISGLQNFAANLAGIAAPALTGWLVEVSGSYRSALVLVFVILLMGVAAYTGLVRERFRPSPVPAHA